METAVVSEIKGRKILYCVLNWGLGHASRSIALIKRLALGNDIIIASDGEAGVLLQEELPNHSYQELPSYGIHYKYSSMHLNMLVQFPKIITAYANEKNVVKSICEQEKIDLIISDHRYGCRVDDIESIFLGHQINIIGSAAATRVNKSLISKFDHCWVPDYNDQRLSGKLSDAKDTPNTSFIGPLTRMEKLDLETRYDIAIVLSGPEPKRTKLEAKLLEQAEQMDAKVCLVRGTKKGKPIRKITDIEVKEFLGSQELNKIMAASKMIVCRSGYSSLMDLEVLNKPALIIPTQGQKEQEYLAEHYSQKEQVLTQTIHQLDIKSAYHQLIV